jgi:hypothetical protein
MNEKKKKEKKDVMGSLMENSYTGDCFTEEPNLWYI